MPSASQKPPSFRIPRILQDRDRLYDLVARHAGATPAGEVFDELRRALSAAFGVSPEAPAVYETVRALPPTPLTARALYNFAWLAAAHRQALRLGSPARPWTGQLRDEWIPFEIMSVDFHRSDRLGPAHMVTMRAMAGSCCTTTIVKRWPFDQTAMHVRRLGFTSQGKQKLPYRAAPQLVRLRLDALVLAELSDDRPRFRRYEVGASALSHNKKLLRRRILRTPPCPQGFAHPCHVCPVGYALGDVVCPAAVHPATWERRPCPACAAESWFDPVRAGEICLKCRREGRQA